MGVTPKDSFTEEGRPSLERVNNLIKFWEVLPGCWEGPLKRASLQLILPKLKMMVVVMMMMMMLMIVVAMMVTKKLPPPPPHLGEVTQLKIVSARLRSWCGVRTELAAGALDLPSLSPGKFRRAYYQCKDIISCTSLWSQKRVNLSINPRKLSKYSRSFSYR